MTRVRNPPAWFLAALLFGAGQPLVANADAPLPPPADDTVHAPHSACVARAEVGRQDLVVIAGLNAAAWTIPGWHRWVLVTDDCRAVGIGYEGGNLLNDADRVPGTAVMRFVHSSGTEQVVSLGDLYPDLAVLPRTASHWLLFRTSRWDGARWTVETVDGRSLRFGP